jgi:deoxyribose-phosphate aldolase
MAVPPRTPAGLAALIDHTILRPEATRDEVLAEADEAAAMGCASVCVAPVHLPLGDRGVPVCTVIGFPSGAHATAAKAAEAELAAGAGAVELDVVVHLGSVRAGAWGAVTADLASVRAVVPAPLVVKAILESAALTPDELVRACRCAEDAGCDLVKTSTGFSPAGGASVEAVRVMHRTVGARLGIKASGGIRTTEQALAMIEAGATRLGASATSAILAGLGPPSR